MKVLQSKAFYVTFLRYSPTIGAAAFIIHYSLLLFGIRTIMADYLFDTSLMAFLFVVVSSRVFGFCPLHRSFIWFIGFCSLDVDCHHWFSERFFPPRVMPLAIISFGVILFLHLVAREIKKRKNEKGNACSSASPGC